MKHMSVPLYTHGGQQKSSDVTFSVSYFMVKSMTPFHYEHVHLTYTHTHTAAQHCLHMILVN